MLRYQLFSTFIVYVNIFAPCKYTDRKEKWMLSNYTEYIKYLHFKSPNNYVYAALYEQWYILPDILQNIIIMSN